MARLRVWLDSADAADAQIWADRLGVSRSELVREALVRHLQRLAADPDINGSRDSTSDERAGAAVAVAGQIQDRAEPS